jgi:TonB family protein
MFANLVASPPPSRFYPPEARKRREHGNVNLKVCADDNGAVASTPEVVRSSGSWLLDEAAQAWARAATWVPATMNQRRVGSCTEIDVAFEAAA